MGSHWKNYTYLFKCGKKMYLIIGLVSSVFNVKVRLNLKYLLVVHNSLRLFKIIVETTLKIKYRSEVLI